jgi:hypothetical protein
VEDLIALPELWDLELGAIVRGKKGADDVEDFFLRSLGHEGIVGRATSGLKRHRGN